MTGILGLGMGSLFAATVVLTSAEPPANFDETTSPETAVAIEEAVQEYQIAMTRKFYAGQQLHVHGEGAMHRTIKQIMESSETPIEQSQMSVTFDANATVMEVDSHFQPSVMSYQVNTCTALVGEETMTLAEPASTIVARQQGNMTQFEINGQPADEATAEALHIIIAMQESGITDDAIFGTDKMRVFGESWSMNSEKFAELMQRETGQEVDASTISGLTTLVEAQPFRGEPCLVLHSHISTESFVPGLESMPSTLEMSEARMSAMRLGFYPLDESLPPLTESSRIDVEAVFSGQISPSMPEGQLSVKVSRIAELQMVPAEMGSSFATVTEPAQMPED